MWIFCPFAFQFVNKKNLNTIARACSHSVNVRPHPIVTFISCRQATSTELYQFVSWKRRSILLHSNVFVLIQSKKYPFCFHYFNIGIFVDNILIQILHQISQILWGSHKDNEHASPFWNHWNWLDAVPYSKFFFHALHRVPTCCIYPQFQALTMLIPG